ncbi:MAG TPA: von Willebrand factor type A domain-containing protein, partial [Chitinophagaceae bacterium]|nr:von Willebrand factor type A domain-containing protein [Chitinophagaceae bacterium]
MYKRLFYIVTILLFHAHTYGQQYYLKGEVRDEAGKLLSNVTIQHVKSGYLYYSGQSGAFGLNFKTRTDSLIFSADEFIAQKILADASAYLTVTLKRKPKGSASPYKLASLTENLKREAQQQWFIGDETYTSIVENQFINSATHPTTGLTLNVDRASYSNVRRFLNMNTIVPPDAIRIEEMLNYFNFGYSEPANNKVFQITSVLTQCPWNASNRLLFSTIKSKRLSLDSLPPTHLVFLIDVSGSMDMANRLPLLKAGFRGLVNNLRSKDSVSIVVYGGTVGVLLDATSGQDKQKIFNV